MQAFRILLCVGLLGVVLARAQSPTRQEIQDWLGVYQAGPEQVELSWQKGLHLRFDRITIPVDGQWHETVPTFAVRHRAQWVPDKAWIEVSERHSQGSLGSYRLKLANRGSLLLKTVFGPENDGQEAQVRQFRRLQSAKQGGQ